MNKKTRKIICFLGAVILMLLPTSCEKLNSTGVYTGYSSEYNSTYCKDDWTQAECEEWDDMEVNSVSWHFYAGQTCDERGTPASP